MSIKIIGAGFPRTGTMSLKKALESLGYSKTYHYKDLLATPQKLKYWKEIDKKGSTDWCSLFESFQASVDFPGYPHYLLLKKKYPHAKVILSTRPFEDWYQSTFQTIWKRKVDAELNREKRVADDVKAMGHHYTKEDCVDYVRQNYLHDQFNGCFHIKEQAEKVFYRHHQEVKKSIPNNDLLIYNVAEGWKPLCQFLNLPIPDITFPHLNKKEDFHSMVNAMLDNVSEGLISSQDLIKS